MTDRPVRDEWLLPTLEALLPEEGVGKLKAAVQESYWEVAVRGGALTDEQLLTALSARFRMKVADVAMVSQQARDIVPETLARKYRVLPLAVSDSILDIATADPYDLDCERTLAFATGRTVRMSLGAPAKIAQRIDEVYRPENAVEKILEGVTSNYDIQEIAESVEDSELDLSAGKATERPVIRLVDHILAEGITSRASDIHLEPEEAGYAVRYRIDGVLRQAMNLPRAAGLPLVSRIKIMASLDIADRLRPQDGRARVAVNGVRIDLRVSTLPASHGEKVVIRILDSRATVLSLDSLGLGTDELTRVQTLLGSREGIVLVTGPTGSGKTTTLYSILRQIQNRGVNIVTVEDPVEYRLQGIVQVQVNEKAGLTFATALRSILRQDPDVVLIGEIRDRETAQIAIQASLTGHLVFSTLHTNDAASSITRLVDIGIESYKIASALKGVVAQRLLRKLCLKCRVPSTEPIPERLQRWLPAGVTLNKAVGCPDCAQTGYRGRLAITEILISGAEVERRISGSESTERISQAAREAGMKLLWDAGMNHVRTGTTSLEELMRVVEIPSEQAPAPPPARRATPATSPEPPKERAGDAATAGGADHGTRSPSRSVPAVPANIFGDAFQLVDDGTATAKKVEKGTVLLVEDEEPLRRVLKDLLEREGYMVVEAQDGVQALDEIDRAAPDIVVLDLNLPRLDGYGVLTHLRSRPKTVELPVIVLTAKGDEDSEVRVFEYGANDFLTKPFRPRALSARLKSMLKQVKG
jgi:type II secretory ATPase GspE/PulE/Tfp pilus assembly ATPase PilB-like protein/CheY-like chemotaxis protein